MQRLIRNRTRAGLSRGGGGIIVAAVAGLAACSSSPPPAPGGDYGDRRSVYNTTTSDRLSDDANMPDLFAFGDRAGEQIALEIAQIPEIAESEYRAVIELGTINNQTETPSGDFRLIQSRLHRRIQQSDHLRDHADVLMPRARMDAERAEILGAEGPDLQEGRSSGGSDRYDPRLTYVLQGDFHESRRGNTRRYWFNFQLANLQSRAIVLSIDIDQAYGQ